MTDVPENDEDELGELRVLVLMEEDEGVFTQVMIDRKHYKALTELISFPTNHPSEMGPKFTVRFVPRRGDWEIESHHFDGLQSSYDDVPQAEVDDDETFDPD